ncbi:MAG: D-alanyl-D-alanine carboxypeptidase [Clostridia bacterium]|nr:D-alanyl-D-alanine carboxypeptidase [Clostridia bacterium]
MYESRNRLLLVLIIFTLILSLFTVFIHSESVPSLSAKAAALYEPETNRFLYTKNADQRLGMASTTKIMTALIALETLPTDEVITVDERAAGIEGSSIYLKAGEEISVIDLVYATLLQSANDAAAALACRIADGIDEFSYVMNERARELGLVDTNFKNPHGLDDSEHYTTARELALLAAEALKNETFKSVCSTYKKELTSSASQRIVVNHNKLLKAYPGCIGVKTGYTKKSGRSLVSAAERDGLTLIGVTINAPDDWRDHTEMLDYGFSLLEARLLAKKDEFSYLIPVIGGDKESVRVSNEEEIKKIFNKCDSDIEISVRLPRYFSAPIRIGDVLGTVVFIKDGEKIAEIDLISRENIDKGKKKNPRRTQKWRSDSKNTFLTQG